MIKWIFFDVGNVIFNDDPTMAMIYERLYRAILASGQDIPFEALLAEREDLILNHHDGRHYNTLGRRYLGEEGWTRVRGTIDRELQANYFRYNLPMLGIEDVLEKLSSSYRLGIAANQVSACRQALEQTGLISYFGVIGLSAQMGLSKPSLEFYRHLLGEAGCRPSEAIMVGDRIDFDVRPAKEVGMWTIWVNLDIREKGYDPTDHLARLYFESQRRAGVSSIRPRSEDEKPDVEITRIQDIPGAVETIVECNPK